jgi:hypothetical protein
MKKSLLLFIIFVVFIVVGKLAYTKYCESKPEGCKKEKVEETPEEGVDW